MSGKRTVYLLSRLSLATLCFTSQISIEQKDPIVNPGQETSEHVHVIAGSSCFSENANFAALTGSSCCTTAAAPDDMSAYWAPMLYYEKDGKIHATGTPDVNVYYKFTKNGSPESKYTYQAFPENFQMRAGNPKARTLEGMGQKVTKWRCIGSGDDKPTPELPNRKCKEGLRAEISFPSCWNGKGPSKVGESDHVIYPPQFVEGGDNGEEGGGCTEGEHTIMLPRLFMEIYFNNNDVGFDWDPEQEQPCAKAFFLLAERDGLISLSRFFLSNGDRSGYALHADFMNGWKNDALQSALDRCDDGQDGLKGFDITTCFANAGKRANYGCTKNLDESSLGVGKALDALPGTVSLAPVAKRSLPTSTTRIVKLRQAK